ncbi:MAG: ubiquinone biosynthesis regulatory protein kinase UbiB [Gammaproteobacteria bacterium]|nr:ubiquinone biosynthesis regulatory protein kinase UbiB [Gammaproteobacteria bacterium]
MIGFRQALRLLHINTVLGRHGLDEIIFATHLFRPVRFLQYLSPWRWFRREKLPRGERIRRSLEDLGPIFIKFGQILSTRRDLLPDDIADELAQLQDNVPAFPGSQARAMIEKSLGQPVTELFTRFDEQPLASASIAQVHTATLQDGREVVVKVVRPDIEKTIRRDLALMHTIAGLAMRYWADGRRLRPCEIVKEFEKTILDELDLMREASSASILRRNFADSDLLYVPEVHWPLTRGNVMVMERIHGIPVSNVGMLKEQNVDLKKLSEHGVEIFFTQVFRDNFFHADMHPGNIFVGPGGRYIAVDFGIMGTLSHDDQHYLAGNFLAFFQRDYRKVAELHVESGWVPEDTRVEEFEAAIRTVCEPIFERPLKDISFGLLLLRLFQTARRFNMEIQPQLVLLQKTLLNIEGLGRQLYPELDLWKTAKPYLERWMSEQIGVRSIMRSLGRNAPEWSEKLPEIPVLLHQWLIQETERKGRQKSGADAGGGMLQELIAVRWEIRRANRRLFRAIVGSAFVISASVIYVYADPTTTSMLGNAPFLTWMLGGLGGFVLLFSWPSHRS